MEFFLLIILEVVSIMIYDYIGLKRTLVKKLTSYGCLGLLPRP